MIISMVSMICQFYRGFSECRLPPKKSIDKFTVIFFAICETLRSVNMNIKDYSSI